MKILDRYIFREMTAVFLIGLVTFTFVLMMSKILRIVEEIVNKGAPAGIVVKLVLYLIPYSLQVTVPMATLLACLACYGRMAADNEIMALKVTGLSLYRLIVPAVLFGLLTYAATTFITVNLLPYSNRALKDLLYQLTRLRASTGIQEGVFNDFPGLTIYVQSIVPESNLLKGVFIVDSRDPKEQRVVIAREGHLYSDLDSLRIFLRLQDGTTHIVQPNSPGRYRIISFTAYNQDLPLGRAFGDAIDRPPGDQELTIGQLLHEARQRMLKGDNFLPLLVEMHKKLAIPVACLLFGLVGPSLGMRIRRGGRAASLVISIAFALGYYALIVAGEGLGKRGTVPPGWAMWMPNVILALVAGYLMVSGAREGLFRGRLRRWRAAT